MQGAFAAVECAIAEVTKARSLVTRRKSKQVSASDEIDGLKAVAHTWFKAHRQVIASRVGQPDLVSVDTAYRTILDSTAKHAARSTYSNALRKAKQALIDARALVVLSDSTKIKGATPTSDTPPDFAPLAADLRMQAILKTRWSEVQLCLAANASLAATVMMGGLLESLLLARINASPAKAAVFRALAAPKDKSGKTLMLPDWKLIHMVEVGHELTWVTKSAKDVGNVLREFRNYIHPHKEYTDAIALSSDDANIFWEVTKAITRQVLTSVGKSP